MPAKGLPEAWRTLRALICKTRPLKESCKRTGGFFRPLVAFVRAGAQQPQPM
jgi:hypothetical protein